MVQTHPKKKIEIVIDRTAVPDVIALAKREGAKGYTLVPSVSGRGSRGIRGQHDIFEEGENAMIVIIGPEDVVLRILDHAMTLLESYAGIAYVSDVAVARVDHF